MTYFSVVLDTKLSAQCVELSPTCCVVRWLTAIQMLLQTCRMISLRCFITRVLCLMLIWGWQVHWFYTVSRKNVPFLACYNFDAHEWILIFFGRNQKTQSKAIKRRFTMPSQITCTSALPVKTGIYKNHFFSLNWNVLRTLPERKNCHLWYVWYRLTFVEIVRYSINTVHWLLLQAWRRTTPIFYTATDTVTDLANTEHVGNTQQDAMLPS